MKERVRKRDTRWEKLDNTANLFPVIATENLTNVYRLTVTLTEEIHPDDLQKALLQVLPWFDYMNVRLRTGIFWYYFETNHKGAPIVTEETEFPCRYIEPHGNRNYLFRVTYFRNRINLEVFHVLADGMGGINFLRELAYQYLRIHDPNLSGVTRDDLSDNTSLNTEDGYLKYYKKSQPKSYKSESAIHIKGEKLGNGEMGVIHGYMSVAQLKKKAKEYDMSINEYLSGIYVHSIYKGYLHERKSKKPIVLCVPVNLRPFFESMTTRNFFAMVSVAFHPEKEAYTRREIMEIVRDGLRTQITKENLERLFSYNVSNQKNIVLRAVPLMIKKLAIKAVYQNSARATTTTITNLGVVHVEEPYRPYIKHFQAILSASSGQNTKATVCSYGDTLVFTFSSILKDVSVQKYFFCSIASDDVEVTVESNGVYYE